MRAGTTFPRTDPAVIVAVVDVRTDCCSVASAAWGQSGVGAGRLCRVGRVAGTGHPPRDRRRGRHQPVRAALFRQPAMAVPSFTDGRLLRPGERAPTSASTPRRSPTPSGIPGRAQREAGRRRPGAAQPQFDRLPDDPDLAGRRHAPELGAVGVKPVAQAAGSVGWSRHRPPDRRLRSDQQHLLLGPGHRGVEQLTGQQRRGGRRHQEGDPVELAALGTVHRHRVHGLHGIQPDRREQRRPPRRERRRPGPRPGYPR